MSDKQGKGKKDRQHAPAVSDARFARLQTDPRFLKPRRNDLKVTLDERFSSLLGADSDAADGKNKQQQQKKKTKLDRYGRKVKQGDEREALSQIYKVEGQDEDEESSSEEDEGPGGFVDYARGEGALESSGSEEEESDSEHSGSDDYSSEDDEEEEEDVVIGSREATRRARKLEAQQAERESGSDSDSDEDEDEPAEVGTDEELDEDEALNPDAFASLDAQAQRVIDAEQGGVAAGSSSSSKKKRRSKSAAEEIPRGEETSRLAVVNLDWDHIKSRDLYRVFSSVVNPLAPSSAEASSSSRRRGGGKEQAIQMAKGRCIRVRVYPSDFGRERMRREDIEGPPRDIFKANDQQRQGASMPGDAADDDGVERRRKSKKRSKRKGRGKAREEENDEDDEDEYGFDQEDDGDFDPEQLRKYQLERLR